MPMQTRQPKSTGRAPDIPPEGIDTPHGRLYRPIDERWQIVVFVASFFGGPGLGWAVGSLPGDLSEGARTFLDVPFVLVFFLGYGAWVARLNAIAFDVLGRSLLKTLFLMIVRKEVPRCVEDVLPSREKVLEMAVRAQKAGRSFAPFGWLLGLCAGLVAMLFDSATSGAARFGLVALCAIAWGHGLAWLGRHGWLPMMEAG